MIDVFGEIAGVSFSPDNHALFLGIADRTYGKAYGRRHKSEGRRQKAEGRRQKHAEG
jgi:secreted PhoX family phosphatase